MASNGKGTEKTEIKLELLNRVRFESRTHMEGECKTAFKKIPINSIKITAKNRKGGNLRTRKNPSNSTTFAYDLYFPEMSKEKIWKNLIVLCSGFVLLFTAYISLTNIISSINSDQGLGVASMSVIYAGLIVSCIFLATPFTSWRGYKQTIAICILTYGAFLMANYKPSWLTLIPTSLFLGVGAAGLWCAKCGYLSQLAERYALLTNQKPERTISLFFGIFFMIFQTSQVFGNFMAYTILKPMDGNSSDEESIADLNECGVNFCDSRITLNSNNTNLLRPADSKIFLLCSIYACLCLSASLLVFFALDTLPMTNAVNSKKFSFNLLLSTLNHLRHPYQLLLVPITIFSGLEQAFILSDFTKAFVTCTSGVHNVSYVMICFGMVDVVCSLAVGLARVDRIFTFCIAFCLNSVGIGIMLFYKISQDSTLIYFVIACLWGAGDAVWQTQINALYGCIFPNTRESAFSNYRLWESVGFLAAYSYSSHLCAYVKIYILLVMLIISFSCYLVVEFHIRTKAGRVRGILPALINGDSTK